MRDTGAESGTTTESHDASVDDDIAADAPADLTVDVTPANEAAIESHAGEAASAATAAPAENTWGEEGEGETKAAPEEATIEAEATIDEIADDDVVDPVDEEADGSEPTEGEGRGGPFDEEWETHDDAEEPIAEVLVDTAIAVGAAAVSMFGSIAGAAVRYAGTTHAGQVVGDITAGVRKAVTREGEPYLHTAGKWSQDQLTRLVAAVTPAVVDALDFTELAERVDMDALLARIDTDALVERVDVERMAERVNVRALLEQLDLSSVRLRVDLEPEGEPDAAP